MIYLTQIISGGQTGADFGGLLAARTLGLKTGGCAPRNYRTENGSNWNLREFGLSEHNSPDYPPRTRENIKNSDGTVIFYYGRLERGSELTYRICLQYGKPLFIVSESQFDSKIIQFDFVQWLEKHRIVILNVAGNRESKSPGIQKRVSEFLIETLQGMRV